jgi:hypothetical protein
MPGILEGLCCLTASVSAKVMPRAGVPRERGRHACMCVESLSGMRRLVSRLVSGGLTLRCERGPRLERTPVARRVWDRPDTGTAGFEGDASNPATTPGHSLGGLVGMAHWSACLDTCLRSVCTGASNTAGSGWEARWETLRTRR